MRRRPTPMVLFNRKNRPGDGDTVRLASADHSWWAGGADDPDGAGPDAPPPPVANDATGWAPPEGPGWVAPPEEPEDGDEVSAAVLAGIADALSEYGFGGAGGDLLSLLGPDEHDDGAELDDAGRAAPGHGDDGGTAELFARDGLPDDDHLAGLLGALGLEGDADWLAIARAHRRLTSAAAGSEPGSDEDLRRRSANEAYARLRLFHH